MSSHYHAVIWIDHHEARIVYFNLDDAEERRVRPAHPPRHLHGKAGSPSGTHEQADDSYLGEVTAALVDAKEFLLTGPSSAKAELVKYFHRRAPQAMARLAGIETLDKVTDNELLAEARRYFKAADRLRPQLG